MKAVLVVAVALVALPACGGDDSSDPGSGGSGTGAAAGASGSAGTSGGSAGASGGSAGGGATGGTAGVDWCEREVGGSCEGEVSCNEYYGTSYEQVKAQCTASETAFAGPCGLINSSGGCQKSGDGYCFTFWYKADVLTRAQVQEACDLAEGTFLEP